MFGIVLSCDIDPRGVVLGGAKLSSDSKLNKNKNWDDAISPFFCLSFVFRVQQTVGGKFMQKKVGTKNKEVVCESIGGTNFDTNPQQKMINLYIFVESKTLQLLNLDKWPFWGETKGFGTFPHSIDKE